MPDAAAQYVPHPVDGPEWCQFDTDSCPACGRRKEELYTCGKQFGPEALKRISDRLHRIIREA